MQEIKAVEEKICSKCGQNKPVSEFLRRKISKDGYRGQCKECMRRDFLIYNDHIRNLPPEEKPRHKPPMGITRTCRKCHIKKDITEFRKKSENVAGVSYACNDCTSKKEWENYSKKFDK